MMEGYQVQVDLPRPPTTIPSPVGHGGLQRERTCIGCRRAVPVEQLLGVTFAAGRLSWGPRHQQTGRGAWIHPLEGCVRAAVKNHGFARAFRSAVPGVDVDAVPSLLEEIRIAHDSQQRSQQRRNR